LMGSGHMLWLAQKYNRHEDAYCKPSPVHCVAAIALAIGAHAEDALEAARTLVEEHRRTAPLDLLATNTNQITIFEDSSTGIVATQSAVEILKQAGINIQAHIIGIATGGEKDRTLETLGADIFHSIDFALEMQWSTIGAFD
jgi:hypothetical protein